MNVIMLVLLVAEPILVLKRYLTSKNNARIVGFVLNPALYFVLLSYFYFLVPGFVLNNYTDIFGYTFSSVSIDYTKVLYCYFNSILFLVYLYSDDAAIKIAPAFLSKKYKLFLEGWLCVLCVALFVVLFSEYDNISSLRQDRIAAFEYYVDHVYGFYKIGFININIAIVSFLLSINSTKKNWSFYLLPFILILMLDYSHGGRAETFRVVILAAITYVIKFKKIPTKVIFVSLPFLILPSYFQRSSEENGELYYAFGEVFFTGMTPLVVLGNDLSIEFAELMLKISLSPLPSLVRGIFYDVDGSYIFLIQEAFGMGFGLAGNFVSEALIYGGLPFALLSPLIISCVLYFINRNFLNSKLFGFLFVIIFIVGSQNMFRTSFYENLLPIFYIIFIYFLYLVPILNKKVIRVYSINSALLKPG